MHGQVSKDHAHLTNIFGHLSELVLEWRLLVALLHLVDDLAKAGVLANHEAHEETFTLRDIRTRLQDG